MKDIRQKRLMELLRYIQAQQVVSLGTICEAFDVSMNTVRRDVSALIEEDLVCKVHGGVMYKDPAQPTGHAQIAHYPSRSRRNVVGKARIGQRAAALVADGDTVFIDSGTTAAEIVTPEFLQKKIMVVSNSLPVFERLQGAEDVHLYALGGTYIVNTRAFTGAKAIADLKNISVTKAFMGASAVNASGVFNNLSYEIDLKRSVAEQAEKVILMADAEKLNKSAAMRICAIERLSALVTDQTPEADFLAQLEAHGIDIVC